MKNRKSKGLGDTVAKITKATGIHSLAQMSMAAVGKKDCGCNKRKQTLNKLFPYETDKQKRNYGGKYR